MTTLYITEYLDIDGTRQVPREPPLAKQTLSNAGAAVASNPFDARTTVIRLHTDTVCSVVIGQAGSSPVATTTDGRMAANQTEYRGVMGGQVLSVILNT